MQVRTVRATSGIVRSQGREVVDCKVRIREVVVERRGSTVGIVVKERRGMGSSLRLRVGVAM